MKIIVCHQWYGCDTGCCGHRVFLYNEEPSKEDLDDTPTGYSQNRFYFDHLGDGQDPDQFAKELIATAFGEDKVKFYDKEKSKIMPDPCEFTMEYWKNKKCA